MVCQLTKHLLLLKVDMVNNNNLYVRHLRDKGLHSNQSGSNFFSSNFLNTMERFWHTKGCLDIWNNRLIESEHLLRPESNWSSRRNNRSLTTGFIENLKGKKRNVQLLLKSISVPKETSLFPTAYTIRTMTWVHIWRSMILFWSWEI